MKVKTLAIDWIYRMGLLLLLAASLAPTHLGCGHRGGVVGESSEYSYEDVAAQIRAEDEAAEAERMENER